MALLTKAIEVKSSAILVSSGFSGLCRAIASKPSTRKACLATPWLSAECWGVGGRVKPSQGPDTRITGPTP